jgi:hypothetical protein
MNRFGSLVLLLACLLAPATLLAARHSHGHSNGQDHVGFGDTITIDDSHPAGDIVCAFCTIRIQGDHSGDLVSFFGDVQVDNNHTLSGDSVVFGGRLGLGDQTQMHGNLVLFGGELSQAPTANISGDRVVFAGTGWLLVLLSPLLIPIGLIWLIVHLVRRQRYRFPSYPPPPNRY